MRNISKTAIETAKELKNHKFHYQLLTNLAYGYYNLDLDEEIQYELMKEADSLKIRYDLEPITSLNWIFKNLLSARDDWEKGEIIKENIQYFISNEQYEKIYDEITGYHAYVYQKTGEDSHGKVLLDMIKQLEQKPLDDGLDLEIKLFKNMVKATRAAAEYDTLYTLNTIEEFISVKKDVIKNGTRRAIYRYVEWGDWILLNLKRTNDKSSYLKIYNAVEPLSWENVKTMKYDIAFINHYIGDLANNKEFVSKYYNRIFTYELDKRRVKAKLNYSNLLVNVYGNMEKSIKLCTEALEESKIINDQELELYILSELGYRYHSSRSYNSANRILNQAVQLAKYLKDDNELMNIYTTILDFSDVHEVSYYGHAKSYLKTSKRRESRLEFYRGQIQAITCLIKHFSYHQQPDSLKAYFQKGFAIKDSVMVHAFVSNYLDFLFYVARAVNDDMTDRIAGPIRQIQFNKNLEQDTLILDLYQEMVYLKDYDFSLYPKNQKNTSPFIYSNVLSQSRILRQYWDYNYVQLEEFNEDLDFLTNLPNRRNQYEWGLEKRNLGYTG